MDAQQYGAQAGGGDNRQGAFGIVEPEIGVMVGIEILTTISLHVKSNNDVLRLLWTDHPHHHRLHYFVQSK